jgi:hypothetical protein
MARVAVESGGAWRAYIGRGPLLALDLQRLDRALLRLHHALLSLHLVERVRVLVHQLIVAAAQQRDFLRQLMVALLEHSHLEKRLVVGARGRAWEVSARRRVLFALVALQVRLPPMRHIRDSKQHVAHPEHERRRSRRRRSRGGLGLGSQPAAPAARPSAPCLATLLMTSARQSKAEEPKVECQGLNAKGLKAFKKKGFRGALCAKRLRRCKGLH